MYFFEFIILQPFTNFPTSPSLCNGNSIFQSCFVLYHNLRPYRPSCIVPSIAFTTSSNLISSLSHTQSLLPPYMTTPHYLHTPTAPQQTYKNTSPILTISSTPAFPSILSFLTITSTSATSPPHGHLLCFHHMHCCC
uniref:Uncharacterized protein n=1 Tax=Opuntia streptacantha TaxID=393608 RepID=A0A7C9F0K2_OPUST